jgi:hypothetical protein
MKTILQCFKDSNDAITQWLDGSMIQFFNQRLRLLQVFRVEALDEPVVNDGQRVASCMPYIALASFPLC